MDQRAVRSLVTSAADGETEEKECEAEAEEHGQKYPTLSTTPT